LEEALDLSFDRLLMVYRFTVCSVILSDSTIGENPVAPQMELRAQQTTLPSHNGEKHRFTRAYLMLDTCELSVLTLLNAELNPVCHSWHC